MHEYLHLAATLGATEEPRPPVLNVEASEIRAAAERFDIAGNHVWLGLNAGAEYGPAKRWPLERFVEAARGLQDQTGCGILLLGGPADTQLANELANQIRNPRSAIRTAAGRTSLRELMALLRQCRALLTNDTGPMHVAAALGVPVIVPFGSTSPELTGPGLPGDPRHRLVQSDAPFSPCFLRNCPIDFRCMQRIPVERLVAETLKVLHRS